MRELWAVVAVAGLAACGDAEWAQLSQLSQNNTESLTDGSWLLRAAGNERSATELGALGAARTAHPQVLRYAQVIQQEHARLFAHLQGIMHNRGAALPTDMGSDGAQQYAYLWGYQGSTFDRIYMAWQIDLQRQATNTLQTLHAVSDPEVASWAEHALGMWSRDNAWARQIYNDVIMGTTVDDHSDDPFGSLKPSPADRQFAPW